MTSYNWPTWADIAGTKFDIFENWGQSGAGNHCIFNQVIDCDVKNYLTPDDTVAILWTSPARHDYYAGNRWGHVHHVFNSDNNVLHCPDGYWLDTFSYIYSIEQILKHRQINYVMASWVDYTTLDSKFHEKYKNLLSKISYVPFSKQSNLVKKVHDIDELMEKLYNNLHGPDWPPLEFIKKNQYSTTPGIQKEIDNFFNDLKNDKRVSMTELELDLHPLPSEHLNIAKIIFPDLNFGTIMEKQVFLMDSVLKDGNLPPFGNGWQHFLEPGKKL